jgi:thiamine biosynthesis lipoprotein
MTQILMGMPITVEIVDYPHNGIFDDVFAYFAAVDRRFSLFKPDSEITAINQGHLPLTASSADMQAVLQIGEHIKQQTHGYFEVRRPDGRVDPTGIVKGWAVRNACRLIEAAGARSYFVDAGGDIQTRGKAADGKDWMIGIRNPFNDQEIVKTVRPRGHGIATSGTYVRGQHIYNPHQPGQPITDIVSLTVIGADVLHADLYATAAFAMGEEGIYFLEERPHLEGYLIDRKGLAAQTTGFSAYVVS